MAQRTSQSLKNAPQQPSEAATGGNEETGSIRSGTSLFALANAGAGQTVANKVAFMGDIRQKLAQVADEAEQNGQEAAETERLADSSATRLYRARVNGVISAEELSGLLVDVFGAVPKQDGTPGKTPAGAGGTIRKRVVRAVQGYDFLNGGDGGRFFETMDKDDVAPIINSIGRMKEIEHTDPATGNVTKEVVPDGPTVWAAYKQLGDIKSQMTVRLPFAFDPKKVMGLTDSLSEAGARDKLIGNPSLVKAYGALFDQLQIISHVDESEEADIAKKLGGTVEPEAEDETENEGGEELAA